MLDYEMGYLAGFIDGEGSLIINKREHIGHKGKRYVGYSAHLEVTNTDKSVMDWIIKVLNLNEKMYIQNQPGNRKKAYRIRIGYKTAKPIIEKIQKYLIVKNSQSKVFLKYGDATREEKESLWNDMKVLNKRGII